MKTPLLLFTIFLNTAYAQQHLEWCNQSSAFISGFVENKGQVSDQYQHPNPTVKYIYTNGLFNLQLKEDGFSYELFELVEKNEKGAVNTIFEYDAERISSGDPLYQFHSTRVDVKFIGAITATIIPSGENGTLLNYYTVNSGSKGITGVNSFYQIKYQNIYPGIDLVFSAPENDRTGLKYEWIINRGADPSLIRMQYSGPLSIEHRNDGSVDILTSKNRINEGKIVAFTLEDNLETEVNYLVSNNSIAYNAPRRIDKTLVIDPNITWFSYYGGVSVEDLFEGEMAIDNKGNPLLAGNTSSPQYIASTGAYQVTYGEGGVDGFVAKFKLNGQLAWATYYGSYDRDGCHAIAPDAANNIFVGGNSFSTSGIATPGSHQEVFGGAMDAFLAKFTPEGIRVWATYLGGTGYGDQINGVACDPAGNVYYTGYTCSPNNMSTPGAYQEVYNGIDDQTGDAMVGEFTTNGTMVWGSYLSGPDQDRSHDIALIGNGDFYIEGTCESIVQFATPGVHQSTYGGGPQDAFIAKWDTNGHLYWCSYYGGEGDEHGRGLAVDSNQNAYIGGWTISTTGIGTPGSAQPEWFEGYNTFGLPSADAYLAKFTPDGQLAWGTYYGGKDLERSRGIAVDKKNDFIYVVGQTSSKSNVASSNIFKPDTGLVNQDGFVSKYSSSGSLLYSYLAGGPGKQTVYDTDLDKFNSLYLFMTTDQTIYTTAGVYQGASKGSEEVLLVKLNPSDNCFDKYEPNNSNLAATDLNTSTDTLYFGLTGVIADETDVDWFRIKTGFTNLKVELLDLLADYDIYLYKSNAQLIATSANVGTADETIIFNNIPKGKYYLRIKAADTDFAPTSCYRVRAITGTSPWLCKTSSIATLSNQLDLQVFAYPNPAGELLNIKMNAPGEATIQATVYDLTGQVKTIDSFNIAEGSTTHSINVQELPSGMYLLELESEGKRTLVKIAVQH